MDTNDVISKLLEEGETVNWKQQPIPFKLIDDVNRKSLLLRWIITIVISLAVLIAYIIITSNPASNIKFNLLLPIIVVVVAGYMLLRPVIDKKMLSGRTFIITDRRAVMITTDGTVKDMSLEKIDEAVFIIKGNGIGDVLLGKDAVKYPYRKIRTLSLIPRENIYAPEGERISGMAFYNVKDFKEVKRFLLPGTKTEERLQ